MKKVMIAFTMTLLAFVMVGTTASADDTKDRQIRINNNSRTSLLVIAYLNNDARCPGNADKVCYCNNTLTLSLLGVTKPVPNCKDEHVPGNRLVSMGWNQSANINKLYIVKKPESVLNSGISMSSYDEDACRKQLNIGLGQHSHSGTIGVTELEHGGGQCAQDASGGCTQSMTKKEFACTPGGGTNL